MGVEPIFTGWKPGVLTDRRTRHEIGASGGTRTHTPLLGADFESAAYTNSATKA